MNDERIKFRHIRCFLEVARHQSVSRAAENLNLAQSAVSRTLAELEAVVGMTLLVRNRRGSHLTRVGREFFDLASGGVAQLKQAYNLAHLDAEAPQTVTFGAVPSVGTVLLPEILPAYQRENQNVTVRVIQEHNQHLLNMLRAAEADFVLGRLISADSVKGLAFEHLIDERVEFYVHKEHPLANAGPMLSGALAEWPIVVNLPDTIARVELGMFLSAAGVRNALELVETNSISLARGLVRTDRRIWLAPEGTAAIDVAENILVPLEILDWNLERPIGIWKNPNAPQSQQTQHLIDLIKEKIAES